MKKRGDRDHKPAHEYSVVAVTWNDACSIDAWATKQEISTSIPSLTITVGHLVLSNKKKIIVASTVSGDDVGSTTIIPRGMIVKVSVIGKSRFLHKL